MRVLVACEFSGIVRDAFVARGHDAWSCDIIPSERPGNHLLRDAIEVVDDGWDLMIAHPPCTFLCNSGVKHLYVGGRKENGPDQQRWVAMADAAGFFRRLLSAPIPRIAVENPVMHRHGLNLVGAAASQFVQPWQFGDTESKRTGLWLKNLPRLKDTNNVREEMMALPYRERAHVHHASPSPDRWKQRSRTFLGIAAAMAQQWG